MLVSVSPQRIPPWTAAVGDGLVGVDASVWLFAVEEVLDHLLDFWNSGGTSDQDDLVDVGLLEAGVIKGSLDWAHGVLEQITTQVSNLALVRVSEKSIPSKRFSISSLVS